MYKPSLIAGTIFAMTAVILGAFGAHYLKTICTPEILTSFETGVKYQFYHAFALIALGMYARFSSNSVKWIYRLLTIGTLFFSGSIYALCYFKGTMQIGLGGIGIITPIGGVIMIAGWAMWLINIMKLKNNVCRK
jgi:uncharacterized membrane protein YgdD (TMEM256/DUF423 family)